MQRLSLSELSEGLTSGGIWSGWSRCVVGRRRGPSLSQGPLHLIQSRRFLLCCIFITAAAAAAADQRYWKDCGRRDLLPGMRLN